MHAVVMLNWYPEASPMHANLSDNAIRIEPKANADYRL